MLSDFRGLWERDPTNNDLNYLKENKADKAKRMMMSHSINVLLVIISLGITFLFLLWKRGIDPTQV